MQIQFYRISLLQASRMPDVDGLEAVFLAEMLKYAAPAEMQGAFSGGIGEAQFASLLTQQRAEAWAQRIDLRLLDGREGRK